MRQPQNAIKKCLHTLLAIHINHWYKIVFDTETRAKKENEFLSCIENLLRITHIIQISENKVYLRAQ